MTSGSLFQVGDSSLVESKDGQNIYGKYKLLYKTANFLSNQFTWMIVFVCFVAVAIVLRIVRTKVRLLTKKQKAKSKNKQLMENSVDGQGYKHVTFETTQNDIDDGEAKKVTKDNNE